MLSQDGNDIPFEIAKDLQGLRLLELPPSLLELIRSGNPLSRLELKSAATPKDEAQQDEANAVLCTQDHTFQVRQVQTSNSVFVLQPNERTAPSDGMDMPVTSLCAVAKCPNMLELVPIKPGAVAFLKQKLPIFTIERLYGVKNGRELDISEKKSKQELLKDAPFSSGEFEEAWTGVCAFVVESTSWMPTAALLIKTWEMILLAATVRGLQLDDAFTTAAIANVAEEEGIPFALIEAIIARGSVETQEIMDGFSRFDPRKCVSWIGATILKSRDGEIAVSDFMAEWQNYLPEAWRVLASLDGLKDSFRRTSSAAIIFDEQSSEKRDATSEASKASTGKARTNWHERFKNTKK